MPPEQHPRLEDTNTIGTRDGDGAADHDQLYRFGWRPTASTPYPFNLRQYLRLLVLRGRIQDGLIGSDDAVLEGVAA